MGFNLKEFLNLNNKEKAQKAAPASTVTPTRVPYIGGFNPVPKNVDELVRQQSQNAGAQYRQGLITNKNANDIIANGAQALDYIHNPEQAKTPVGIVTDLATGFVKSPGQLANNITNRFMGQNQIKAQEGLTDAIAQNTKVVNDAYRMGRINDMQRDAAFQDLTNSNTELATQGAQLARNASPKAAAVDAVNALAFYNPAKAAESGLAESGVNGVRSVINDTALGKTLFEAPQAVQKVGSIAKKGVTSALLSEAPGIKGALIGGVKSGGILGTVNALDTEHPTVAGVVKGGIEGAAQNALLSGALHVGGSVVGDLVNTTRDNHLVAENKARVVAGLPERPTYEPSFEEHTELRDLSDALTGSNPATGQERSQLQQNAIDLTNKTGIDFVNGSLNERVRNINSYLTQLDDYARTELDGSAQLMLSDFNQAGAINPLGEAGNLKKIGAELTPQEIRQGVSDGLLDPELAKNLPRNSKSKIGTRYDPNLQVNTSDTKPSRFANKTVQMSEEVSPALKNLVKEESISYTPTTNKKRLDTAEKFLKGKSTEKAYAEVIKSFENTSKTTDQDVVNAIKTAKKLDVSGTEADLFKATEIYDNISRHLTAKGQEIQAASLLSERTSQGLRYSAQKALRRAGVEPTPEILHKINTLVDDIEKVKNDASLKEHAVKVLQQYVGRQIPTSATDKALGIWKAGLLTGAKTITGNAVSNAAFRLLHEVSKPLAYGIDQGAQFFNKGERSQAMTYRKGVAGTIEGFKKAFGKDGFFWTGIDERQGISNKFLENGGHELNYKNKAVNAYVNGVFRNMAAQDRPFYYSQLRSSTYELATVEGLNKGLKGKELRNYADAVFNKPSLELLQRAKTEADKAVLAFDTPLSKIASSARKGINSLKPGIGKTTAKIALETTAPFTGVPSAFVSRVLDFTPVGAIKEAADQIAHKKFDQRALTNAIAEAGTGTALIFLGSQLAKNQLLSGAYPTDSREQARWKAEGITPNSVKVGNKWVSLNYLGPAGMLFNAGSRVHDATENGGGAIDQITAAASGAPKDLTQQSFLQGLNNAVSAVNDPGRYFSNYVNSQAGSLVPTLSNDIATATDSYQRDKNSALDAIKSRLPGARETLPISNDVFGNQLKATSNPVDRLFNPLRPSAERTSDVFGEVNRLKQKELAVTPTPLSRTQTFDGVKVPLTSEQQKQLQTQVGQNVQKLWDETIKTSEYKSLDDDAKKKALDDIYSTVLGAEKRKFAADNSLGQYAANFSGKPTKITTDQANYINGSLDASKYTSKDAKTKADSEYAVASSNRSLAMTRARTNNDLQTWGVAATEEYDALEEQKKSLNPNTDQVKINAIIKKQESLKNEAQKYTSQGYIKKPAAVKKAAAKKSKYDYAKGLASINTTAFSNAKTLRDLVKKTRITKRSVKA